MAGTHTRTRPGHGPLTAAFAALLAPRTWTATLYLLLTLPLGIAWFTLIVTEVATGVSLIVVWVGVPLLVFTLWQCRLGARLERRLIRALLGADTRSS